MQPRESFMNRLRTSLIRITLSLILISCPAHAEQCKATGTIDAYFSPRGGAMQAIVKELDNAKKEILVQAYSFTSAEIIKALVQAHKRGVFVEVIIDKSQASGKKYTSADYLAHVGIPTYIDSAHAIAHNKIMIIDRDVMITGSFNFTKAAEEKNAENLLVIKENPGLLQRYARNYEEHRGHSERYGVRR
jgi:phosphatidylserine/phosphatidylglycerophosphate/cardiolipin synthase-like enzyme